MTYRSRGRSIIELVFAVTFVGFLVGFIAVLCIGNYLRARRAMERQRQRRISRQLGKTHNGSEDGSYNSRDSSNNHYEEGDYSPMIAQITPNAERQNLLNNRRQQQSHSNQYRDQDATKNSTSGSHHGQQVNRITKEQRNNNSVEDLMDFKSAEADRVDEDFPGKNRSQWKRQSFQPQDDLIDV